MLILLLSKFTLGQYITPGDGVHWNLNDILNNSGGVLTFENDSYFLWSGLTISANDTLSIITDEEINIQQGVEIRINGVLICEPPSQLIIAAIDSTLNFKGLSFDNADASILRKCRIEFGGGIKLIGSDVLLDSCIIRKNNQSNCSGTIDMINSSPVIQNCMIADNFGPAVLSSANGNSSPLITGNTMLRNCSTNLNMPQINLGTSAAGDTIRITENTITGLFDNSGGIAVTTLAGGSLKAIIEGNTIENNRYGITAYGMNISTFIKDNVIINNNIQGDPMLGGSGINFWGDQTNISIVSGNEISGNLWGITVQNQARPNMGQVDPDTLNPGKNLFFDNGNNGVIYALYNNTPNSLFAENNFWGTFDPDTVEMYIFHLPDDPALGLVDYLPIKDFFTGTNPVKFERSSGLTIFPNPADHQVKIIFPDALGASSKCIFQVLNMNGRLIFAESLQANHQDLDISFLPCGIFQVRLISRDSVHSGTLIKK
jgi:hypothetical protein